MRPAFSLSLSFALWSAILAAALALADGAAGAPDPATACGVSQRSGSGFSVVEACVPGPILAVAAVPRPGGGRELFLLVAPAGGGEGERDLYRLDSSPGGGAAALHRLRQGLSAGLDALDAIDLNPAAGESRLELLAGEPHRLYCLGSVGAGGAELTPCALAAPGWFDLLSPDRSRLRAPRVRRSLLATAEAGRVRFFAAVGPAAPEEWRSIAEERLPLEVSRERRGLRLVSPPLSEVGSDDEAPVWFAGPQAAGRTRLRMVRIAPRAEGEARRSEAWCRLPGPERVEVAAVRRLDGVPHLLVLTVRADKISVFEKLALRVFPLSADRTRAGRAPTFAVETEVSRWRRAELVVRDADGDGRDDLLVVGPLGLRGGQLGVAYHAGLGRGRFRVEPVTTRIADGDREARLAADLTGDGRLDLVLLDGASLAVHAGVAPGRRGVVGERPRHVVTLAATAEAKRVEVAVGSAGVSARSSAGAKSADAELLLADLDGDGRAAAIVVSEENGRGIVRILRFDPSDRPE